MRPASTITREKLRHQVPALTAVEPPLYRGYWAQQQVDAAKGRCGRKRKLDLAGVAGICPLSDHVRNKLRAGWSPKAIACRLKRDYPNETNWHLSAMTIYDAVYILPHSADLDKFSQAQLDEIDQHMNDRPRKILGWQMPNEVYAAMLENVAVNDRMSPPRQLITMQLCFS